MGEYFDIVEKKRKFFDSFKTLDISYRIEMLKRLKNSIQENENEILMALKQDLNKSAFESYISEISIVLDELNYFIKHTKKLSKAKKVSTPIAHFPSTSKIYKEPYGVVLIMSPWNYPFQLTLVPLIGAIAAGNCVVLKTSTNSPRTSDIIDKIIKAVFPFDYVSVIKGASGVSKAILCEKFDYIFFTGSAKVGKIVMSKAAENLTPITLELGGKSPCIVDKTADIDLSAKRIAWGKFLNAGQTCVAPDYIMIDETISKIFLEKLCYYIEKFYGIAPENNKYFPMIITQKQFDRICGLISTNKIEFGGKCNTKTLTISPTIIINPDLSSELMQNEIFGPILPIITYNKIETAYSFIKKSPKPLALYLFTTSNDTKTYIKNNISFGGGCINDSIIHLANNKLPFGGVGASGMNSYHGIESFNTFSHTKSILEKKNWLDINLRYPPYSKNLTTIKKILK